MSESTFDEGTNKRATITGSASRLEPVIVIMVYMVYYIYLLFYLNFTLNYDNALVVITYALSLEVVVIILLHSQFSIFN